MTWLDDHAADEQIQACTLIEIDFATPPLRMNDLGIPVYFGGNRYGFRPYRIDGLSTRQLDIVGGTLEVGDGDNAITAYVVAAAVVSGVAIRVYEARWASTNKSAIPTATRLVHVGTIDSASIERASSSDAIVFQLGPPVNLDGKILPSVLWTSVLRTTA